MEGRHGDFVLYESGAIGSLFIVQQSGRGELVVQQIDAPLPVWSKFKGTQELSKWIFSGAPDHTQWLVYEFDPHQQKLVETYSLTRRYWIEPFEVGLLERLFYRNGMPHVQERELKKIGPRSPQNGMDRRKVWVPPTLFWEEGSSLLSRNEMEVRRFDTQGTALDGYQVDIYYQKRWDDFLLPCWIEIGGTGAAGSRMAGKWMGRALLFPTKEVPKRMPLFLDGKWKKGDFFEVTLELPSYWKEWSLLLYPSNGTGPLCFPCKEEKKGRLTFDLSSFEPMESQKPYTARLACQRPAPYSFEIPCGI